MKLTDFMDMAHLQRIQDAFPMLQDLLPSPSMQKAIILPKAVILQIFV